jgi:hypothetical protein
MTDGQMAWHVDGKWSSAEILEHLSLAYSRTAARMRPLLQENLPEVRRRTFTEWIGGIIVLKLGRIVPGRKAPEALTPRGASPAEVKIRIEEKLGQLDMVMNECAERFGSDQRVLVNPVLGPLSLSEWRKFHRLHTLHHMKQIHALRKKIKNREIR